MQKLAESDALDVVLYGGTFDPPHAGHGACVRHVQRLFPAAQIEILPSPQTVKVGGDLKMPAASFVQRLEMCRLAFQIDMQLVGVGVSDLEAKLPQPYYTVNLVQRFIAEHPGKRVAVLMGMDQFRDFPAWRDPRGILTLCDLVVVKRENGLMQELLGEVIGNKLGYSFNVNVPSDAAKIKETGRNVYFIDQETSEAASREIREMIKLGQPLTKGWLTPSVEKYIEQWALYRF